MPPRSGSATIAAATWPSSRCRGDDRRLERAGGRCQSGTPDAGLRLSELRRPRLRQDALDPVTLDYVRSSLDHIDDGLLRQLVWMSIWEMVRDAQLRSTEFLAICRHRLP